MKTIYIIIAVFSVLALVLAYFYRSDIKNIFVDKKQVRANEIPETNASTYGDECRDLNGAEMPCLK